MTRRTTEEQAQFIDAIKEVASLIENLCDRNFSERNIGTALKVNLVAFCASCEIPQEMFEKLADEMKIAYKFAMEKIQKEDMETHKMTPSMEKFFNMLLALKKKVMAESMKKPKDAFLKEVYNDLHAAISAEGEKK